MKLNDIDLNKLAVFVTVSRAGGVTKAATQLGLTPSAVSQSIKALETALAVKLFDRVGKSFLLSPEGSTLAQGLSRYQDGLQDALGRLRQGRGAVKGQLRLGVFYGFANALLADFLARLRRSHPEIEVDVLFGAPSELDRLVSYGRLDAAVNLFKAKAGIPITGTLLAADELWLVSSQPPPRRALGLSELRKAPFIDYYRKSRLINGWIHHHFGQRVRDVPIAMYASQSELVVQLILRGAGIGIVAASVARPFVERGDLFVIRGKRHQLVSPIWWKERKAEQHDPVQKVVRSELVAFFG